MTKPAHRPLTRLGLVAAVFALAGCAGGAPFAPETPHAPIVATTPTAAVDLATAMGLEPRVSSVASAARPEAADLAPLDDFAALAGAPIATTSAVWAVHLASYRSKEAAARGWTMLAQTPGLEGLQGRVHSVDLGPEKGAFDRLKAGPLPSRTAAEAVCARLTSAGAYCQPTDFTGEDL